MVSQFDNVDLAGTVKALAKEHGTTIVSLVSAIVESWLANGGDVATLELEAAKKRGRKADVNKVDLAKFSEADLAALQAKIAAMTSKG